jgi:hypothetical protein
MISRMTTLHNAKVLSQEESKFANPIVQGAKWIFFFTLTPKIPFVLLTNFGSFWPTWRNPFLYPKKYENLKK